MDVHDRVPEDQPTVDSVTRVDIGQRLANAFSGGQLVNGHVILPNSQVSMRASLIDTGSTGRATVLLRLDHPDWDRTFFESITGVGETEEEALDQVIVRIALNLVYLIDNRTTPDLRFTTTWAGYNHDWSLWCGFISSSGTRDSTLTVDGMTYLNLLMESIKERLGNQIVSYVQICAEWFEDEPKAEVRMNSVLNPHMSALLETHMREMWPPRSGISHQQLLWITQDQATQQPYSFTYDDIKNHVITVAHIFHGLWLTPGDFDQQKYELLATDQVRDRSLALEISSLVPEIATLSAHPDLPVCERITIDSGGVLHHFNICQLASYAHIREAIDKAWCEDISEEILQAMISYSQLGRTVNELAASGQVLTDLRSLQLISTVGEGYQPR